MQSHPVSLANHSSDTLSQCLPQGYSPSSTATLMALTIFSSSAAWLLLGFLAAQTYTYYTNSAARDPRYLKAPVYGSVFVTTARSAFEGFFVDNYIAGIRQNTSSLIIGQPRVLTEFSSAHPIFDALPALLVQFFFTWRIWSFCMKFYGRKVRLLITVICGFIILTSLCAFISVLLLMKFLLTPSAASVTETRLWLPRITSSQVVLIWTSSTAGADITITACMMAVIYHARCSACHPDTRGPLSRILRVTLQTGLLTSALAIPVGPLYFRRDSGGEYGISFFLLHGKSYLISLLSILNARPPHPIPNVEGEDTGSNMSTIAFRSYPGGVFTQAHENCL